MNTTPASAEAPATRSAVRLRVVGHSQSRLASAVTPKATYEAQARPGWMAISFE